MMMRSRRMRCTTDHGPPGTRITARPAGISPALLALAMTLTVPCARASSWKMMQGQGDKPPEPDKPFVLVDLGVPPGYTDCTTNGISPDGRFVIGTCTDDRRRSPDAAFVWDRDLFFAEPDVSPWIMLDPALLPPPGAGRSADDDYQAGRTYEAIPDWAVMMRQYNSAQESIVRDDSGRYHVVLGTDAGNYDSIDLADFTLLPRGIAAIDAAAAINDRGFIAATVISNETGARHAAVIIPRDDDNNGTPDIRDIFADSNLDGDGDWVLDSIFDMRVGLFSPGTNGVGSKMIEVANVQVIRLMGYSQGVVHCMVSANPHPACERRQPSCARRARRLDEWGHQYRTEIIINFRTVDPDPAFRSLGTPYDYLAPASGGRLNAGQILRDIRLFAFNFARCIDGFQAGNDIYNGPGRYYFHRGDLRRGGYEGDIRLITSQEDLDEASTAIFAQLTMQLEAARMGSALAGRPLKMFGPSVSAGFTRVAYCGDPGRNTNKVLSSADRTARAIGYIVEFVNDNSATFDQHLFYTSIADLQATVDRITDNCVGCDPNCPSTVSAPWPKPLRIASLELGPVPTNDWWEKNGKAAASFFTQACDVNEHESNWTRFVNQWKEDPTQFDGDYQLAEMFTILAAAGFRYACVNALQRGVKGEGLPARQDMGALRADRTQKTCVEDPEQFMPIRSDYESAAQDFMILFFDPHPDPCDCAEVCPSGCG